MLARLLLTVTVSVDQIGNTSFSALYHGTAGGGYSGCGDVGSWRRMVSAPAKYPYPRQYQFLLRSLLGILQSHPQPVSVPEAWNLYQGDLLGLETICLCHQWK